MTTGPTDVKVTTAAGGPDGMPLALRFSEGLGFTTTKGNVMTNSELSDAILVAKAMVDATGSAAAVFQALCSHLKQLLEIQAARAGHIEQAAPFYVPRWEPSAPWAAAFRGDGRNW